MWQHTHSHQPVDIQGGSCMWRSCRTHVLGLNIGMSRFGYFRVCRTLQLTINTERQGLVLQLVCRKNAERSQNSMEGRMAFAINVQVLSSVCTNLVLSFLVCCPLPCTGPDESWHQIKSSTITIFLLCPTCSQKEITKITTRTATRAAIYLCRQEGLVYGPTHLFSGMWSYTHGMV